jgi:pyrimidine-specific ribonucleoside hydrolase
VQAVAISYGEAHPQVFAPYTARLMGMLGRADIPVGVGSETPLSGDNAFPDPWRDASDGFWSIELRPVEQVSRVAAADDLIIETVHKATQPVVVFISGSHTNLAQALRKDPTLSDKIRDLYVMGGSIYTPGNIESDWPEIQNQVAEWNIWVDPLAASEVFSSGIPIHLVPLDATRQVVWRQADVPTWRAGGIQEGKIAAGLLQLMLDTHGRDGMFVWDLVAAVHASHPAICPETTLNLEVLTGPGPEQGQTAVTKDGNPVSVSLNPDQEQVKALASGVLAGK